MRFLHAPARTRAVFDDPNLLAHAGLAPLLALADRAGLPGLLAGVTPAGPCGANAGTKAMCLVAGMAAGADSIDDMDLLRDGAMDRVFGGIRAPSTLGSFLRSFTWGNVRQLDKAHRGLTAALAADLRLLPGRDVLAFIDVDSTQERVYGYQKEGAAFGHAKVQGKSLLLKGLNPLISVISTPLAAPVLGPVRLRRGSAGSTRGAAGLLAEAIGTAREAGCTGKVIARFDSAFCNSAVIRTAIRHGAHFSVTVPMNTSTRAAIAAIPEENWTAISYPQAIWDDQLDCWVSDAEVAETSYTAFTSKPKKQQVTARLIVRRVRARNEKAAQGRSGHADPFACSLAGAACVYLFLVIAGPRFVSLAAADPGLGLSPWILSVLAVALGVRGWVSWRRRVALVRSVSAAYEWWTEVLRDGVLRPFIVEKRNDEVRNSRRGALTVSFSSA